MGHGSHRAPSCRPRAMAPSTPAHWLNALPSRLPSLLSVRGGRDCRQQGGRAIILAPACGGRSSTAPVHIQSPEHATVTFGGKSAFADLEELGSRDEGIVPGSPVGPDPHCECPREREECRTDTGRGHRDTGLEAGRGSFPGPSWLPGEPLALSQPRPPTASHPSTGGTLLAKLLQNQG